MNNSELINMPYTRLAQNIGEYTVSSNSRDSPTFFAFPSRDPQGTHKSYTQKSHAKRSQQCGFACPINDCRASRNGDPVRFKDKANAYCYLYSKAHGMSDSKARLLLK